MALLGIYIIISILILVWFLSYYTMHRRLNHAPKDLSLPEDDFAKYPEVSIWEAIGEALKIDDYNKANKLLDYYSYIFGGYVLTLTIPIAIVGVILMGVFPIYQSIIGVLIATFIFTVSFYSSHKTILLNRYDRLLELHLLDMYKDGRQKKR